MTGTEPWNGRGPEPASTIRHLAACLLLFGCGAAPPPELTTADPIHYPEDLPAMGLVTEQRYAELGFGLALDGQVDAAFEEFQSACSQTAEHQ